MQSTFDGSHTSSQSSVQKTGQQVALGPANALTRYEAPDGRILYGAKRGFRNVPLNTNNSLGLAGHIFKDGVHQAPPSGHDILRQEPIWEPICERRMELEVFCRWHGVRVLKACSAELVKGPEVNDAGVLHQLQREVMQMEHRLHKFHEIEVAKRYGNPKKLDVESFLADPMLVSDPDLSDFSESSDDDFQSYIPDCLMHEGIPRCCMGYHT